MGMIRRVDGALIGSGKTFVLVMTGEVPVGLKKDSVGAWVMSNLNANLGFTPHVKAVSVTVVSEAPEDVAKRLLDAAGQ